MKVHMYTTESVACYVYKIAITPCWLPIERSFLILNEESLRKTKRFVLTEYESVIVSYLDVLLNIYTVK